MCLKNVTTWSHTFTSCQSSLANHTHKKADLVQGKRPKNAHNQFTNRFLQVVVLSKVHGYMTIFYNVLSGVPTIFWHKHYNYYSLAILYEMLLLYTHCQKGAVNGISFLQKKWIWLQLFITLGGFPFCKYHYKYCKGVITLSINHSRLFRALTHVALSSGLNTANIFY